MTEMHPLVSGQWLREQEDNPQVVIVDCRFNLAEPNWGRSQYEQAHIPGAFYLDLNQDLSSQVQCHGGRHPLPDLDQFAQTLSGMGITSSETWVVAYDDARFAFASRLWWLLRYLGHERVSLLDGGWKGWKSAGYPVSDQTPNSKPGQFISQPHPDWTVDIETLKTHQNRPNTIVIDSRDGGRYRGEYEPIDPIAGSVPGAVNFPWKEVSNEAGVCKPITVQQERWRDISPNSEIIVYCGSGVTACVNLFSLYLAGITTAKLYPGGWSDWCSYLVESNDPD